MHPPTRDIFWPIHHLLSQCQSVHPSLHSPTFIHPFSYNYGPPSVHAQYYVPIEQAIYVADFIAIWSEVENHVDTPFKQSKLSGLQIDYHRNGSLPTWLWLGLISLQMQVLKAQDANNVLSAHRVTHSFYKELSHVQQWMMLDGMLEFHGHNLHHPGQMRTLTPPWSRTCSPHRLRLGWLKK